MGWRKQKVWFGEVALLWGLGARDVKIRRLSFLDSLMQEEMKVNVHYSKYLDIAGKCTYL